MDVKKEFLEEFEDSSFLFATMVVGGPCELIVQDGFSLLQIWLQIYFSSDYYPVGAVSCGGNLILAFVLKWTWAAGPASSLWDTARAVRKSGGRGLREISPKGTGAR